jgi:enoyl-CoA hydratase/carnithine racemase
VRAVIVTGRGRAFCAGRDISGGSSTFDKSAGPEASTLVGYRELGGRVMLRLFEMNKPLIGAINGLAIGMGGTMTLAMDIRIATDTAQFGFVFTRRGITPKPPRPGSCPDSLAWASLKSGCARAGPSRPRRH